MGWIHARCLIMNLIHFGMEMCFIGTSVELIFCSSTAGLRDALESTSFMRDILERNMV